MDTLLKNARILCEQTQMLSGLSIAYGTPRESEGLLFGCAQRIERRGGAFVPLERPLAQDSLFDLASLTKLFTAVLAMALVERGRLSLDEYVGDVDSRFANLRDVRVGDLLAFRVSLKTPGRIDEAPSREEGLARLFAVEQAPTPAVRVYSDMNAMVAKYILEARTGRALYDALRETILIPAGMAETFARVPDALRSRCVCYNYEHRIERGRYILRCDTPPGAPHDPKALLLSDGGRDLCGHAGLFSTRGDMVCFAQALLRGELISPKSLARIGANATGRPNGDGTYRQYLGMLCFTKHPLQRLSEVPDWMGEGSIGLSGFTGNHLSLEPRLGRFVLFLGNRCHGKVSHITPGVGRAMEDYGPAADGTGLVRWPDGRLVPSSARYVYFKDSLLHAPIARRMRERGWLA